MANILGEPQPKFTLRRPFSTTDGFGKDPDPKIKTALAELNRLLAKQAFSIEGEERDTLAEALLRAFESELTADVAEEESDEAERAADEAGGLGEGRTVAKAARATRSTGGGDGAKKAAEAEEGSAEAAERTAKAERRAAKDLGRVAEILAGGPGLDLGTALRSPLTPRRAGDDSERWADGSLAAQLDPAAEADHLLTLAEVIDGHPGLSKLNAEVTPALRDELFKLPETALMILGGNYPAIRDYLVVLGYGVLGIREADGLVHFIAYARRGVATIADYAIVSAGREVVKAHALNVPDFDDDDSAFVKDLRAAAADKLRATATAFESAVLDVAGKQLFRTNERELFESVEVGDISDSLKESIISQMVTWPGGVNEDNARFVVYSLLGQAAEAPSAADGEPATPELAEEDFDVEFVEDDADQFQVNRAAVKCAAQLYYTMVVGDELNVFGAVEFLTHRFLLRSGAEISDPVLRRDLQDYVFSGRYTDLKTQRRLERTRAPERQMFTCQVFSAGSAPMTDEQIVNEAFPRLWKVLMLESAHYLEQARQAFYPDSYVSKQNVMQAVEDLQYNLSTHCTGMATVSSPLVYKELDFVIRRFLKNRDVLRQVSPNGGTWLRAVEQLTVASHGGTKPNAIAMYNKARLGHDIIAEIAAYDPPKFENNDVFSSFIAKVDAYITTQSILQDVLTEDVKRDQLGPAAPPDAMPPMPEAPAAAPIGAPVPAAANGSAPHDEWDF